MCKKKYNFNLFSQSRFFSRWLYGISFVSLTIILLILSYLYILLLQVKTNDNHQQNDKSDKTLALIDPRNIQLESSLSTKEIKHFKHILYVISLDGSITAIDVRHNGRQLWTTNTGSPLVDSTISKIEILRDSKSTRLIPSLHGGLFRLYDESEHMEPLPFDAESLLNTSFQIHDELIMTGGKYIDTFGLHLHTGQTIYSSSKDNDDQRTSDNSCSASILIVKRIKQTVRARCIRTGIEKWNFSVSNHELIEFYVSSSDKNFEQFNRDTKYNIYFEYQLQTGLILAFNSNDNQLLWTTSINNPIAAVWEAKNGLLKEKSLLKTRSSHRLAYMGKFNTMPYVLISSRVQRQLISNTRKINGVSSTDVKRPLLSFWHKTNLKYRLPIDYELSKNKNERPTDEPNYPLAIRQDRSWDNIGYLSLVNSQENIIIDEEKTELSIGINMNSDWILPRNVLLLVSSVCLCTVICIVLWFLKQQKSINIKDQSSIISENKEIHNEHQILESSSSSFQSRYLVEYEHVRFLGRGGFGIVFESINKLDERRVAIKRVPLKKSSNKERALKEIRCLAVLNHPNLIQYYYAWHECPPNGWQNEEDKNLMMNNHELTKDSLSICSTSAISNNDNELEIDFQKRKTLTCSCNSSLIDFTFERSLNQSPIDDNSNSSLFEHSSVSSNENLSHHDDQIENVDQSTTYFYFVMELCQLDSLRNRLMKQTINRSQVWTIFYQILNAIEYIHSQKLIHRDLKPSNILFSMDNIVKIGDFGLVSAFGEEKINDTEKNKLSGTVLYMSPEQMNRQSYNQKVDIYALGIILFELLYPFSTQMERIRTLENIRCQTPIFPNDFECNESFCHLIRWLLAYSSHDRPKACEFRQNSSYQNILKNETISCS